MAKNIENDLGLQPIAGLMAEHGLKPNDLVRNSTEQLTHKMVSRTVKGQKIINALNKAAGKEYGKRGLRFLILPGG